MPKKRHYKDQNPESERVNPSKTSSWEHIRMKPESLVTEAKFGNSNCRKYLKNIKDMIACPYMNQDMRICIYPIHGNCNCSLSFQHINGEQKNGNGRGLIWPSPPYLICSSLGNCWDYQLVTLSIVQLKECISDNHQEKFIWGKRFVYRRCILAWSEMQNVFIRVSDNFAREK